MPKRIDGLQAGLLAEAKATLLERGYRALTIRGVARACGVAVGTVYNYFPSKYVLAARVMLEDWEEALAGMRAASGAARSVKQGLRAMFDAIRGFCALYRGAWRESGVRPWGNERYGAYREKLRGQLAGIAGALLARFGLTQDPYLPLHRRNAPDARGGRGLRFRPVGSNHRKTLFVKENAHEQL